ncbi:NAD(P)H-dependent oxidoreductase [Pseudoalteromonas sp. T1lg48]|uniref:NAD(P)H-dependent oxidoreductase n=1 Tax=Pseudoalteromonas sp. T1lg48 TaxID=2077100 RepID=UPI00131A3CC4|nr:NAD(P)H-dependent oxidoreductase [Pseudoalteromonas sp. T1lg48]
MNIHLVVAHPEKQSFNFALHELAVRVLTEQGATLRITDLYGEQFDPVAGHNDVINLPELGAFNLAKAQRWALEHQAFCADIYQEQEKLIVSDVLVMQFPLWWWSFPAVLKGWIDRVLSSGFAYGEGASLAPKKVMYSITTGGASDQAELDYYRDKIAGLYQDIFGFIGWQALPPFIAHGVQKKSLPERRSLLEQYERHLLTHLVESQTTGVAEHA